MKISLRVLNADPSRDVLTAAWDTENKQYNGETIGPKGWKKWMISEHKPIELITLYFHFEEANFDSRNQLVRHTKGAPKYFCASGRPDRNNGKPRDYTEPVNWSEGISPLALMAIARQRLCNAASDSTINEVKQVKRFLMQSDDPMLHAVGWAMVPNCVYRSGCCEPWQECEWYSFWSDVLGDEEKADIFKRYDKFNEEFMMGATL